LNFVSRPDGTPALVFVNLSRHFLPGYFHSVPDGMRRIAPPSWRFRDASRFAGRAFIEVIAFRSDLAVEVAPAGNHSESL